MARQGYTPKKRNSYTRPIGRTIVFALEGKNKTEHQYLLDMAKDFKGLITVKFADGNETDPVSMMKSLLQKVADLELEEQDLAFSLVDSDCNPSKDGQMREADVLARKTKTVKVRQIVSSPCFEIWYLLHYTYTTAQFARSSDVVDLLRSKYMSEYSKALEGVYSLLRDKQDTACRHADQLYEHCKDKGARPHTTAFTPSTEMFVVIDEVKKARR
ncbi:MAG: RloB domain-containing protein [Oscillospiraceae bacterium]|nr:RloB domain-containing protein [Oscillospiraceae bacterium]